MELTSTNLGSLLEHTPMALHAWKSTEGVKEFKCIFHVFTFATSLHCVPLLAALLQRFTFLCGEATVLRNAVDSRPSVLMMKGYLYKRHLSLARKI